jgi:hypothetical protein
MGKTAGVTLADGGVKRYTIAAQATPISIAALLIAIAADFPVDRVVSYSITAGAVAVTYGSLDEANGDAFDADEAQETIAAEAVVKEPVASRGVLELQGIQSTDTCVLKVWLAQVDNS